LDDLDMVEEKTGGSLEGRRQSDPYQG